MNDQNLKPFKKGKSGNPKGKPAGTLSMTTKIREFLMEYGKDGETNADKLKRAMVLRAITKSDVLAKEILDAWFSAEFDEEGLNEVHKLEDLF